MLPQCACLDARPYTSKHSAFLVSCYALFTGKIANVRGLRGQGEGYAYALKP